MDLTDPEFWEAMSRCTGPDVYWSEYFRVRSTSNLEKDILRLITHNPTKRPAITQMIGKEGEAVVRDAKRFQPSSRGGQTRDQSLN